MRPTTPTTALLLALALLPVAWGKDELIPTKPKARTRLGKQNPLHDVADDMDTVARRLKVAKTGDTTQDGQKAIVHKLDRLIEMARQQAQKPPKGGDGSQKKRQQQQKKRQPKPDSQKKKGQQQQKKTAPAQKQQRTARPGIGPAAKGEGTGKLHTDAEEWGNLPPAIRDQLLQTQGQGFPLKYRELLRRYYRELAKPRE